MRVQEYQERKDRIAGWPVAIRSYRLGATYHVTIQNEEPGAWVAKADGPTLAVAEATARREAAERLAKTKRS